MTTVEFAPQDMTAAGIPISLRPFFQEYNLESLDPDRDAFTVIERTLARGDMRELRWLFLRFGSERLGIFVQKYGARLLPRRRVKYWTLYFGLAIEMPQKPRWNH